MQVTNLAHKFLSENIYILKSFLKIVRKMRNKVSHCFSGTFVNWLLMLIMYNPLLIISMKGGNTFGGHCTLCQMSRSQKNMTSSGHPFEPSINSQQTPLNRPLIHIRHQTPQKQIKTINILDFIGGNYSLKSVANEI